MIRHCVALDLVGKDLLDEARLGRSLAAPFINRLGLRGVHQIELLNLAVRVVSTVCLRTGEILESSRIGAGILPVLRDGRKALGCGPVLRLDTRQVRQQPAGARDLAG